MMVSPTACGSIAARSRAAFTATTPRSAAVSCASEPPNFPMGVRTAAAMNTDSISFHYNSAVETEELKILLALEPTWTVSLNGLEFQTIRSSDITFNDGTVCAGKWTRKIDSVEWLRPNVVRLQGHQKFRTKADHLTFYPGERLPAAADLRRRRRSFQTQLGHALAEHFKT